MRNMALGVGIFIIIEVVLFMLLSFNLEVLILTVAGVIITLLTLLLINQSRLLKHHQEQMNHLRIQKIRELNEERS
ncbi:hypothetical protein JCM10914A_50760 [Paenibacillus sp. JCM 10914]|uniref:hypothetical protein n=1 Tax=Paenibacillus sp. JCM 10914 TaxID=1236974 RepID=UPI0003CC6FBB|nr:hypothetical protein [Paenibacillus sp. JCM 10914]GAE05225.1 hypothetical protein JCM10914_1319 [Paenibacillus sp. JCM 10914]